MSASDWIVRYAAALGVTPPSEEEIDGLLGLAGIAAHASERTAAPLSAWLAGKAGIDPSDARAVAKRLGADAATDRTGER